MLDKNTIQDRIAEYRARLGQIDDERAALLDIIKGHEALIRATSEPDYKSAAPVTFPRDKAVSGAPMPVGVISMRGAVRRILSSAGRPMHSKDIADEALKLGASTTSDTPASIVDLILLNLAKQGKVEKTAPRTWRWTEVEPRALKVPEVPTV
jgi:HB1, ASXL, restriction endonuclease HTH domain